MSEPGREHGASDVDIVIVGAGMVGATLALALLDTPYTVALVDAQSQVSFGLDRAAVPKVDHFEPRVSALTQASRNLLADVGAWQHIAADSVMPYQKMMVWDQLGTASIHFDAAEFYCDSLGFITENSKLVAALHDQLTRQANIKAYWSNRLEKLDSPASMQSDRKHLLVLQDGTRIQCDLLVAADGANSRVRQMAGMATRQWDYQHHAIVATVETELRHGAVARQCFSESGPLAFLPLQDSDSSEKFCSIVWSLKPEIAAGMMSLDDAEFARVLSASFESRLGEVNDVSKRFCFPLRQRHAKSYVAPGVALVGDAAHTIHPLAGQGVNLGFKDVQTLAEILKQAGSLGLGCDDMVLLRRYQRQRQGDNLMMMGAMEGFKQLFAQSNPLVRWARNTGLRWVDQQGFIKSQIVRHAMGLSK